MLGLSKKLIDFEDHHPSKFDKTTPRHKTTSTLLKNFETTGYSKYTLTFRLSGNRLNESVQSKPEVTNR